MVKNWKRRYFVLDPAEGKLSYYAMLPNPKKPQAPAGSFPVRAISDVSCGQPDTTAWPSSVYLECCFEILLNTGRTYFVYAVSEELRNEWIYRLRAEANLPPL